MSMMVVFEPIPAAILAAFTPTIPPPKTKVFAGGTPGIPPISTPRPPIAFSKNFAPSWVAILPATSLIGMSKGNDRSTFSTVSYAIAIHFESMMACVSVLSAAK